MKGQPKNNNKITLTLIIVALGCFAFLPQMQAVNPPPDGCYPNYTTAEGCSALNALTSGAGNTGLGWYALFGTSTGSFNTAVGGGALVLNNGDSNTATGAAALLLNTSGAQNTAIGTDAMVFNDTGGDNTAVGAFALFNNADGSRNNAIGSNALYTHGTGSFNNAVGGYALQLDENGASNNALGDEALQNNVSGSNNTAVGDLALSASNGDYNTAIGAGTGTDPDIGSNNVYIGDPGFAGDTNVISIGGIAASGTPYEAVYFGGIFGSEVNTGTALPVYVDTDGHLGTSLVNASGKKVRMRNPHGAQPQASLKELQKQQKRIAELEATVARQQQKFDQQQKQIELLTVGLQKVSAQLETSRPEPRIATNTP